MTTVEPTMDSEERALFERAVAGALADAAGSDPADPTVVAGVLDEVEWFDALQAEPELAVSVLFSAAGRVLAPVLSTLGQMLGAVIGGDLRNPTAVLPPIGTWQPPGRLVAGVVTVRGLAGSVPASGQPVVVACAVDGGIEIVEVDPTGLDVLPVRGMDPALGMAVVSGSTPVRSVVSPVAAANWLQSGWLHVTDQEPVPCEPVGRAEAGTSWPQRRRSASEAWSEAVVLGQVALSLDLIGASRSMLELARAHALDRVQFDRPIASFQAVRHRLAESLVAIEGAEAVVHAAWEDLTPSLAKSAKAAAGLAARTTARHCQQVLAGIGFTYEHPFHRYLRRVLVLAELFGGADALTCGLGSDLLRSGSLAACLPL